MSCQNLTESYNEFSFQLKLTMSSCRLVYKYLCSVLCDIKEITCISFYHVPYQKHDVSEELQGVSQV